MVLALLYSANHPGLLYSGGGGYSGSGQPAETPPRYPAFPFYDEFILARVLCVYIDGIK